MSRDRPKRRGPRGAAHRRIPSLAPTFLAALLAALFPLAGPTAALEPGDEDLPGVSLGLKAGCSLAQHQGVEPRDLEYTVSSSGRRGLAAGVMLLVPITARFGLQQELLFLQKGSRQEIGVEVLEIPTVLDVSYEMDYLEVPVLLRCAWLTAGDKQIYSLAGFSFGLKLHDRYRLAGVVTDGVESIPLSADSDMSEVDLFDFAFAYGVGIEVPWAGRRVLLEYRFDLSLERLPLPAYARVPFGDEEIVVENEPVGLRNQAHVLCLGIRI